MTSYSTATTFRRLIVLLLFPMNWCPLAAEKLAGFGSGSRSVFPSPCLLITGSMYQYLTKLETTQMQVKHWTGSCLWSHSSKCMCLLESFLKRNTEWFLLGWGLELWSSLSGAVMSEVQFALQHNHIIRQPSMRWTGLVNKKQKSLSLGLKGILSTKKRKRWLNLFLIVGY